MKRNSNKVFNLINLCTKGVFIILLFSISSAFADTLLVNKYLKDAWKYKRNNTDSSFYFSGLARKEANKINYKKGVALSYKMEASAWYNKGNYAKAIEVASIALKKLKEVDASINDLASTTNLIGLA